MTHKFKIIPAVLVSLIVLAACDESDNAAGEPSEQFGAAFAEIFNTDPNSEPANIDDVVISYQGVDGPNFTAEPVNF